VERNAVLCRNPESAAPMTTDIVIDRTWPTITKALRNQEGRTIAAIAFMTKPLLSLRNGDILVCDSSRYRVASGDTDPKVLLAYLRKGVRIWHHPNLHAKAIVRGRTAIVGSANSSNASSSGQLSELVAIFNDRSAVAATRDRIEALVRRGVPRDPVTLEDLVPFYRPAKRLGGPQKSPKSRTQRLKARAWCIGTHNDDEHPSLEVARRRGTPKAAKSAKGLLGARWSRTYKVDDDVSWNASSAKQFLRGDLMFDVLEKRFLRPPGTIVHVEPATHHSDAVLFICRERRQRSRGLKNVRKQVDQKIFMILKRANMRQLTAVQLDNINQIFSD